MEFIPQNELERALMAAATDPAARPRFYQVLSSSDLLVVDESQPPLPTTGQQVLEAGQSLRLRQVDVGGLPHVPAFSSSERISAVVKTEVRFLAMNAKALFETVGRDHVILNPGSPYGKQFTPDEMAQVVDGSIFAPHSAEIVAEARQVLMGQPSDYPTHVTNALAAFFKTKKDVRAAYLAHVLDPKAGEAPHTMIGVEVDEDAHFDHLMGEASIVLRGVAKQGEFIDLLRITSGGVSDYMTKQTTPFYKKKWLGLF